MDRFEIEQGAVLSKHFLFTSVPAHGHVNPTLAVAAELVRRGHRVSYATHESFRAAIEATGATILPTGDELQQPPQTIEFSPEQFAQMIEHTVSQASVSFPVLVKQMEQDPPDVVCYDIMTFTGRMLAEKLGVPAVAFMPSLASNDHFSLREQIMPAEFDPEHPVLREAFATLQRFASEHGVGLGNGPMDMTPENLNIVFVPREFQIAGETFDDSFRFVGPSLGARTAEPWDPPKGSGPLLFISLGTTFNNQPEFFRQCLDAFADGVWRVAVAVGERLDPADLGSIPGNVEVRTYFPQPSVLQHADVFLSHAGMGSTMESLYAGVPMVTVPQMGEQEANARRVEELGLGRRLVPSELSPELLRSTVDEVAADEAMRGNLADMSKIMRGAGGPAEAGAAIEEYATNG